MTKETETSADAKLANAGNLGQRDLSPEARAALDAARHGQATNTDREL